MKEKNSKRKVKMRGLRVPRVFVWFLGWLHGRKGMITCSNGECHSAYLNTKIKDYQSYSARLWKATAQDVAKVRRTMLRMLAEHEILEQELADVNQLRCNLEKPSVQQLRKNKLINGSVNTLDERKKIIRQQLPQFHEMISGVELKTEEELLDCKAKIESLLHTYLQGALRYLQEVPIVNIPIDDVSKGIYERDKMELKEYCKNHFIGGESYV